MKIKKKSSGYLIATLCLVLFCLVPIIYRIFPLETLPMTFFGAAMGAIITVFITHFLLKRQSETEEMKECNVRIFTKKSQLFQSFIDMVWEIWTEEKITCEQYEQLTSNYYKNLMMYIKDNDKLGAIGTAISKLGDCLEMESYINNQILHENIIIIINELSAELGLGGKIGDEHKEQIEDHDYKLFIVKFRKAMRESFNKILVSSYSDIFCEGKWIRWHEGNIKKNHIVHDDLVFDFKKYQGCSMRYGFAKNVKVIEGKIEHHPDFIVILYVPVGANYHGLDDFRDSKTGDLNRRILIKGHKNLFQKTSEHDESIPSFNFDDKEKVISIRKDYDYHEIADMLAQRAKELFPKLTTEDNIPILKLLEEYYGK